MVMQTIGQMAEVQTFKSDRCCEKCGELMMTTVIKGEPHTYCRKCIEQKIENGYQRKVAQGIGRQRFDLFENISTYSDLGLRNKRFSDYEETNDEQVKAKQAMREIYKCFLSNKPVHGVISGATGTGKSHLAMALCNELLDIDNPKNVIAFINWEEFYNKALNGIEYRQTAQEVDGQLYHIKIADFVVIDDLGSEVPSGKEASSKDRGLLMQILRARENRSLLITTNQSSKEIQHIYGERAMSRIKRNLTSKTRVAMTKTKDYREALEW